MTRGFRDYAIGMGSGLLLTTALIYGAILMLARHVDYDWDSKFVRLHDRWDAKGVKPGGEIDKADAPAPGTDW